MKKTTIRLTLLLALAAAIIVFMAGCGTKTLEDYFSSNPEKLTEVEDTMESSGGGLVDCTFTVKGNTANYILKFKQTYPEDQVQQLSDALANQMDTQKSQFTSMIKSLEEETGISGITCHLEYQNGDGKVLYETDLTK